MGQNQTDFASYVPRLLLGPNAPTSPQYWEVEGSLLFADVSGFTRLAERLARQGKAGAEQLVTTLSHVFTDLLSASDDGGDLLKFGGDALLVFYDGEEHAARACHAAASIRRTLQDVGRLETPQGRVRLRISQGIHSGRFPFFLVGDDHLELIVGGRPATTTTAMESAADASEILVSEDTAALIDPRWVGERKDGGRLLGRVPLRPRPAAPPPMQHADGSPVERFIPVLLRDHLGPDTEEHEHRQVTVAFVHFYGVDDIVETQGAGDAFERIHRLTLAVQRATQAYGVCIICTDIGPDGGKFMMTSGTPFGAEDHEARMLKACREILDSDCGLSVRIGVNRGHVFGGDVGAPFRRTYSTMGDAVNLAARIMGKAHEGQLLAHRSVVERANARFQVKAVPPFLVKGKTKPVEAMSVGDAVHVEASFEHHDLPLVGRWKEHTALTVALDAARAGTGRVVELIGEAGIGKSRLAAAAVAEARDLALATVVCDSYEQSTPFVVADILLRRVLSLDISADATITGERLKALVQERAPELAPWLPLLAIPLRAKVASTREVDELDPRFRRTRMHAAVSALLNACARRSVVVVEDAHWMDDASAELLAHAFNEIESRPWLALVARRPEETGLHSGLGYTATKLHLQPLDDDASNILGVAASEHAPLPHHRMEALVRRAAGNPLFLLELVGASSDAADSSGSLPDSVEALLAAKIDRLAPDDRRALRCIAVLGLRFPQWLVDTALEAEGVSSADTELWSRLSAFVFRDGHLFGFRHDMARSTAYEGLTYARRRVLHGLVADALEARAEGRSIEPSVLALHSHRAGRFDRSWELSRRAAEQARDASANIEATELYEQALAAARQLPWLPRHDIARVCEELGDAAEVAALYPKATRAYQQARSMIDDDLVAKTRLSRKDGTVQERIGRYVNALRAYGRALGLTDHIADAGAQSAERGRLRVAYAGVRFRQGRLDDTIEWARDAASDALQVDDLPTLANAYYLLNAAYTDLGKYAESEVFRDIALPIYEQLGDLTGMANVLNNLGVNAYYQGQWDEALELYERSRQARERAGDIVGAATQNNNIAEILSDQGHLKRAGTLLQDALRTWKAAEYPVGVALAMSNLGRVAARAGHADEALALLGQASALFADIHAEAFVLETRARQAEALLVGGRCVEAWEAASDVLAGALDPHQPLLVASAHRLRGQALAQGSSPERARECFEQSIAVARVSGADYELALTLQCLADVANDDTAAAEAVTLFERLGVTVGAADTEQVDIPSTAALAATGS